MKANKALKRLAKIEASMSDVAKRFSVSAPHIQGVLKDLKAAIVRVKEAVTAHTASSAAKKKAATSKASRTEKKAAPARKKSAVKGKSGSEVPHRKAGEASCASKESDCEEETASCPGNDGSSRRGSNVNARLERGQETNGAGGGN